MTVIALDLGATKLASAGFTAEGDPVERHEAPLDGRGGAEVGKLLTERIRSSLDSARRRGVDVRAVGIGVPGIYRSPTSTVWAPNIPGWDDYPLLAEVRAAVPDQLPVAIDSDRACCILGETWRGAARGARDAIFLAVGTGIGAGILTGGRVVRGHADIAGAIGWLALDRPYGEEYTDVGCFEYHGSGAGIARRARRRVGEDAAYQGPLREKPLDEISARDVFEAYEAADPIARCVLDEALEFWAMALANLVSIFNPEKVIFGGGVFGPAARFLDRIREQAAHWAQPIAMGQVAVTVSALGADAALYGAARLALEAAGEL